MKMKPMLHLSVSAALIGILVALPSEVLAAPLLSSKASPYVPGEVLVKFKPSVSVQARKAAVAALGGVVQTSLKNNAMHVKLNAGQTVAAAVATYGSDPNVEYAQPNYIYHITAVPNDPVYGQSWALKNTAQTVISGTYTPNAGVAGNDMNVEPAWGHITDCSSVVVAVVDSGVNYNQEDLAGNMWASAAYPNHGANFTGEGAANDPMDLNGHGTHVAGIIGAVGNNNIGTSGVCWKATIMAVRVMDSSGSGTSAMVSQGLDFAVANGAKVVNMSLGGSAAAFNDQIFSDAITNAQANDVVVVVAAGNEASDNDVTAVYPCNFTHPNLICVAALDQDYALANFSNWSATSVDVGAPGTNILNTWAGTSTTISDPLDAGWSANKAGWGYNLFTSDGGITYFSALTNPATWGNNYLAGDDDHFYKSLNLSGYDAATLNFYLAGVVNQGDTLSLAMSPAGGDPFPTGAPIISGPFDSPTQFFPVLGVNITQCNTASCTIGFALQSATTSIGAMGPVVAGFSIDTLTLNNTGYHTIDGTSMASPGVAGLATMLRAYNPQYSYADVVAAIKTAGRTKASLAGKTTTSKAVDVAASLAYINKPTGLAATVQ